MYAVLNVFECMAFGAVHCIAASDQSRYMEATLVTKPPFTEMAKPEANQEITGSRNWETDSELRTVADLKTVNFVFSKIN